MTHDYDTRGFAKHDRQLDADAKQSDNVDEAISEGTYTEDWLADIDLNSPIGIELHLAIGKNHAADKPTKLAIDYSEYIEQNKINSIDDFFGFYAAGETFYTDLNYIIGTMDEDSETVKSLREFVDLKESDAAIERMLSAGEP